MDIYVGWDSYLVPCLQVPFGLLLVESKAEHSTLVEGWNGPCVLNLPFHRIRLLFCSRTGVVLHHPCEPPRHWQTFSSWFSVFPPCAHAHAWLLLLFLVEWSWLVLDFSMPCQGHGSIHLMFPLFRFVWMDDVSLLFFTSNWIDSTTRRVLRRGVVEDPHVRRRRHGHVDAASVARVAWRMEDEEEAHEKERKQQEHQSHGRSLGWTKELATPADERAHANLGRCTRASHRSQERKRSAWKRELRAFGCATLGRISWWMGTRSTQRASVS